MAFTGSAVFAEVSDRVVKITGLALGNAASGVLGLYGDGTAEVQLPDGFQPEPYRDIDLAEAVEVSFVPVTALAAAPAIQVVKSLAPFQITLTNGNATPTGNLEIWLRFH